MNQYNVADAHRAAILSDYAYGDADEAPRSARDVLGANEATLIEAAGTEFLIATFGPDVWIAFRGTTNFSDWITNTKITLKKVDGIPGRTHSGFADSSEMALPDVLDAVEKLRGADGFVIICGHSKGGAEAIITAAKLYDRAAPIAAVYVFGCPAVGDRDFARAYDEALGARTFRHVYGSDFVARSPFILRMRGQYHDVGELVYLTRAGGRTFRPSPLRRFVDIVRAFSRKRGRIDHDIANYIGGTI